MTDLDPDALEAARKAVEDVLIEMRDARISIMGRGNGFVCLERDGTPSRVMRLGTPEGLRIGIEAYLQALEERGEMTAAETTQEALVRAERERRAAEGCICLVHDWWPDGGAYARNPYCPLHGWPKPKP